MWQYRLRTHGVRGELPERSSHHAVARGICGTPWRSFAGEPLVKRIGYLRGQYATYCLSDPSPPIGRLVSISLQGACTPQFHPDNPISPRI